MSTMSQRSHLTDSEAWRVVGKLEGGQTQAEVVQAIGVSQSVNFRIWNRFLETGSAGRRSGQGRRRAKTPNEDRYLVLTARRHQNINAYSSPTTPSLGYWQHGFNSDCPKSAPWCRSICSPTDDMNPIDHVWDALGRRVASRQPPSQTLQELEKALLEEWNRIPQLVIKSLFESMP
ncbi:uncharacterized protein TNCV_1228251 [Trichonephila clavipes]|nr:uncharacterized protein TNCV_1228251 [Trichonephila clavipes]